MVVQTKEACQEIFAPAQIFTIARVVGGITLSDMEAVFGRLVRTDAYSGGDHGTVILDSENQERTRVFNFTEIPITKVGQDGIRQVIMPVDPSGFIGSFTPSSGRAPNSPAWWSALAKTQNKPHDLINKIVVTRSRFFLGKSIHEIKSQLRMSRMSEDSVDKLLSSTPFTAYYGGKKIQAIYAMFMYVVDINEFKGYLHLHERSTDTFISICDPVNAPAHPWDVANAIIDCRAVGEPLPRQGVPLLTYRLVYHEHLPRKRYLKEGSTIVELVPEKDLTTEEGFYKQLYVPDRADGVPGYAKYTFLPMEKVTEEEGFYITREGAIENKLEAEMLAARKQQQNDQEQLIKTWIASSQADAKAASAQYKEFYTSCLEMERDKLRKQSAEFEQFAQTTIKERAALQEQINNLKAEANDRKREHEENMLERKEMLEALKLIPAILTVVGAFMALNQKGKKK